MLSPNPITNPSTSDELHLSPPQDPKPKKEVKLLKKPSNVVKKPKILKSKSTPEIKGPPKSGSNQKNIETVNKKAEALTTANEKLKKKNEELLKEVEVIKSDRNLKELEVEKLTQYWGLTRHQLEKEQQELTDMECKLQKMKTAHAEQISLLTKRIRMLQLNATVYKVTSTQTNELDDQEYLGHQDISVQTGDEWTPERVHATIRRSDDQLAKMIAELESEKLKAQNELKFTTVQMEQRYKEEKEVEIRRIKEEKEKQLEEIIRLHNAQLTQVEEEKNGIKSKLNEEISKLKTEWFKTKENLAEKEEKEAELGRKIENVEKLLNDSNESRLHLEQQVKRFNAEEHAFKRDTRIIEDLRNRLEKIEDINEILLGEFRKLEQEKNHLAEELERFDRRALSIANITHKTQDFTERIEEIRKRYHA
uniref:Uncharacterized protein n=1 Tax=Acrobeloides nanus TaxID=290746 RepID=A0A914BYN4_9BILA